MSTIQHIYNAIAAAGTIPLSFLRRSQQDDTPPHKVLLNYDLWYRIASYLSVDDARVLSMVCRECHAATLRRAMSIVQPVDKDRLQKLCLSMSVGTHYPASLLQELRIGREALGVRSFSSVWIQHRFSETSRIPGALVVLLEKTVNLRVLSLQCVEDLLTADTRLGDTLAGLERLDALELLDIGPETFAVGMRLKGRPATFTLSYESRDSSVEDLLRLVRLPLLEGVRKLSLYRFQFGNASINRNLPGADMLLPIHAVQEVCLSFCAYLPFYQLFPDLRRLSMWRVWRMFDADMDFVAWPSSAPLEHVIGDQHNVRCLLGTPVRWLDIKTYFVDGEARLHAMRETVPIALSLWCTSHDSASDMLSKEFWGGLVAVTRVPEARLRYLLLTLNCGLQDGLRWAHEIAPLLAATNLVCIQLVIVDANALSDSEPDPIERHGNADRVPSHWQAFFRLAQTTLAGAIPSLRVMSTLFVPKRDEDLQIQYAEVHNEDLLWWHVLAHHGDNRFESMPREAGEKVHRYLLSDEFEQTLDLGENIFL